MRKIVLIVLFACSAVLQGRATVYTVTVTDFQFLPATLSVSPGDTIKWEWKYGSHSTTSTRIPGDAATWDALLNSGSTSFMYAAVAPGIYGYKCTRHEAMDMIGSFRVVDPNEVNTLSPGAVFALDPNPATNNVHMVFKQPGLAVQVVITNSSGEQVSDKIYEAVRKTTMDLRDMPVGKYTINATQGDVTDRQELFVTH
jgi:plastocyanin